MNDTVRTDVAPTDVSSRGTAPAGAARRLRSRRGWLLLALLAVLAVVVGALLNSGAEVAHPGDLDPQNPGPNGARAVSRVLADRGVTVQVARSAAQMADLEVGPGTVVVVTDPSDLGRSTARAVQEQTRDADLVVLDPSPTTTDALGVDVGTHPASLGDPVPASCRTGSGTDDGLAPLLDGLDVEVDRGTWFTGDGAGTACFRGRTSAGPSALLAAPRPGLVLFGAGQALSNDSVLHGDNAAVALRLLGRGDHVVWYVPDAADLTQGDAVPLRDLLPPGLVPALLAVAFSVLGLLLWRGRRFGPLASEPLPVVVHAAESTRGRGRLLRRSGDRTYAAGVLRRAARRRMRDLLRTGPVDDDALVAAVAARTGRDTGQVAALLLQNGPAPTDDPALTRLATDLAGLDREVNPHD